MPTTIYALCEPDLKVPVIRYIGKTVHLFRRFRKHLTHSSKESNHLGCWLRSLYGRGEQPVLLPLTEIPDDLGSAAEILYIRLAREGGMDLVNSTDGGDGCENLSPEGRAKISVSKRGSKNPNFGKCPMQGRTTSPETRAKMSASSTGEKNAFFGKIHSADTKIKIGEAVQNTRWLRKLPLFSNGGGI